MDCIMCSAARLNLQMQGTATSIAQQQWDLSQPPIQASQYAPCHSNPQHASLPVIVGGFAGGLEGFPSRQPSLRSVLSRSRA